MQVLFGLSQDAHVDCLGSHIRHADVRLGGRAWPAAQDGSFAEDDSDRDRCGGERRQGRANGHAHVTSPTNVCGVQGWCGAGAWAPA
ncbi:hypothetical protein, partial [Streptomyces sp. NPDC057052]|uniref:hypothetical protein n=1 Tax=Streptomyces sp. NPDC057052 TaxID=3346010 RepID=UPI00362EAAE9